MIGLGKCDSCSNKSICKFVEKMKEYEESVRNNVIGEHTHIVGFFPISVKVDCETYEASYLSRDLHGYTGLTTTLLDNNDSVDKTLFKSGLGVIRNADNSISSISGDGSSSIIRGGNINTECGLGYEYKYRDEPMPIYTHE